MWAISKRHGEWRGYNGILCHTINLLFSVISEYTPGEHKITHQIIFIQLVNERVAVYVACVHSSLSNHPHPLLLPSSPLSYSSYSSCFASSSLHSPSQRLSSYSILSHYLHPHLLPATLLIERVSLKVSHLLLLLLPFFLGSLNLGHRRHSPSNPSLSSFR